MRVSMTNINLKKISHYNSICDLYKVSLQFVILKQPGTP